MVTTDATTATTRPPAARVYCGPTWLETEPAMVDVESAPLMTMEEPPPPIPAQAESYTAGEFEIPEVSGPQGELVDAGVTAALGQTFSEVASESDVAPPVMEHAEPEAPPAPEPPRWVAEPTEVTQKDRAKFPEGSVTFDCALLMRNIEHEWHNAPDLYV